MKDKFNLWYANLLKTNNLHKKDYVNSLRKSIKKEKEELQMLINMRMTMNMSINSDIDDKIKIKNENLAKNKINIVKSINGITYDIIKQWNSIYKKLCEHPKIDHIEIEENNIYIFTKKLIADRNNIGNFKIKFNNTSNYNAIHIENLEFVVRNRYAHWHICDGSPCLHEWGITLEKFLKSGQFFFFIDTIIHYLEIANSDDGYINYETWLEEFTKKKLFVNENNGTMSTYVSYRNDLSSY